MAVMSRMSTTSRSAVARPMGVRPIAMPHRSVVVRAENKPQTQVKEAADKVANSIGNIGDSDFAQKARDVTSANARGGGGEYITKTPIPAFTREREINVGRTAMVGFLSAVIGELITHKGIIGQVASYTNASPSLVGAIFVAIIGWSSLAVLPGLSETYSEANQADVAKRPAGPPQGGSDFSRPLEAAGNVAPWAGFTRENELFNGRMAQLGFLAALTGEWASGLGPLGQVAKYLGQQPTDSYYGTASTVLGLLIISFLGGAAISGNWGQQRKGEDKIY